MVSARTEGMRPVNENHREIMMRFCSLGNNCEFGAAQRKFGAEPIDLFRWAATNYKILLTLIENRFEGIGDPENIVVKATSSGEPYVKNTRYNFVWHAFADKDATGADIKSREVKRLPFLARKLIEEISEGDRMFVIKAPPWDKLDLASAAALRTAMMSYGGNPTLMFVDDGAEKPSVERVAPQLLHGHVTKFADQEDVIRETRAGDWLALCEMI